MKPADVRAFLRLYESLRQLIFGKPRQLQFKITIKTCSLQFMIVDLAHRNRVPYSGPEVETATQHAPTALYTT
jgi:hypothetical protein